MPERANLERRTIMRKLMAVIALFGVTAVPTSASAQGNFLDFGKATAGIVVFGAVACALTRAVSNYGLSICTPSQRQYGRPIQQQQAYLLPQQHPMYSTEYRYLGRIYVPAGQQPVVGNVPPAPPAAPQVKVTQLPPTYALQSLTGYCRPHRHLWAPATCADATSCASQAKCVDD